MAKTYLKKWSIGGIDQWIRMKEDQTSETKPVLLFYTVGPAQLKSVILIPFSRNLIKTLQLSIGISVAQDFPIKRIFPMHR